SGDLVEALEQLRLRVMWNPDAGVAHGHTQASETGPGRPALHCHHDPATVGEFHGIAEQIEDDLHKSGGIAEDGARNIPSRMELDIESLAFCFGFNDGDRAL